MAKITPDTLAKEFEDKATALDKRAKVLLAWVLIVVIDGIGLVLGLPPLIAWIDQEASGVDTPKVVNQLRESVKKLTRDLDDIDKKRKSLIGRVSQELKTPFAVWKRSLPVTNQKIQGVLHAFQPLPGGGFLAVGREGSNVLLLSINADGRKWTPIRPTDKQKERIRGRLFALQPSGSGFLAVGREGSNLLLLRINADGRKWTPIQPIDKDKKRIRGILYDLQPLPGVGFLAVGQEGNIPRREIILLRINADGRQWTPIRPADKDKKRIRGSLLALQPLPGGGFLAVGSELGPEGSNVLLLNINADGRKWTPIRQADKDKKRIRGILYALQRVPGGGFLAVGSEGSNLLLLRINADGRKFTPIRPAGKDNKPIQGRLYALQPLPGLGFMAVGIEGDFASPQIILLRINADGRKFTPIRPADKDNKPIQGMLNALQLLLGGEILAVGSEGSSIAHRVAVIRSTPYIGLLPTAGSVKNPKPVVASIKRLIKSLTNDTLLLPQSARSGRAEARDLLNRWKTLFLTLTTTQNNLDSVVKLWGESRPLRRLGQIASRIAVIALLIYLVQILVNLYRYNKRLAAFYQARRDAIILAQAAGTPFSELMDLPFNELVSSLSPDGLDFGKAPAPPTQQSFEIFRDAAKVAAKPK